MSQPNTSILLPTLPDAVPLNEAVLFAFDDWAFPFQHHMQKHLIPGEHPQMVLEPGAPGSHDEAVLYYGTVLKIENTFHLWYFGSFGDQRQNIGSGHGRPNCVMCYATSDDGIQWRKPELGLVEFNGSTKNNIVDLPDPGLRPAAAILYEPDDCDPARRYKLAYEATVDGKARFCVAFSEDGLHWTRSALNPVGPFLEMAGIVKWRGMYYVCGQGPLTAHRPFRARHLTLFASADFEHWSPCGAVGLDRSPDISGPSSENLWNHIEEIHLGAGLWNRGNVIVGIYGQWHGHPSGDRRFLTMDLGLALSHDALHYVEPIPGFAFIPAREQPFSPQWDFPALMQGQGMENVGDSTLYWYSLWKGTEGTGIRLVQWERDRLGYVQPFRPTDARVITCPIHILEGGQAALYLNISGLGEYSDVQVCLLDEGFRPIVGYEDVTIQENGLSVPIRWSNPLPSRVRFRVEIQFGGIRPEDCRLYALVIS